jgi:hypothetical protein
MAILDNFIARQRARARPKAQKRGHKQSGGRP